MPNTLSQRLFARARRIAAAAFAVAGVALVAASPARAQELGRVAYDSGAFASFTGGADAGAIYLTHLSLPGQANAASPFLAFCLDINNQVKFEPWDAYFTKIDGSESLAKTRQYGLMADPLTAYRRAGWLADQFATTTLTLDTLGIQGAIWNQFGTPLYTQDAAEIGAIAKWTAAADVFATSARFATYDYSRFRVVSDAAINADPALRRFGGAQELIMEQGGPQAVVPEPTSVALVGAGMLGVGGVARRRVRGARNG